LVAFIRCSLVTPRSFIKALNWLMGINLGQI
jgi:hypothetical protein